ncbi:insA N-terminal domain protein [Escherichia coli 180050]|nr:insA N-terminal domain protein [Escherichia coli 180050]
MRNGKSTAGHQRYLCSHCRKTWQLQFTYTASQPGTHQKIIDMAMNGVGCRATARIMGVGLNTILRHILPISPCRHQSHQMHVKKLGKIKAMIKT